MPYDVKGMYDKTVEITPLGVSCDIKLIRYGTNMNEATLLVACGISSDLETNEARREAARM